MTGEAVQSVGASQTAGAPRALTKAEYLADAVINVFGVAFAIAGAAWLLTHVAHVHSSWPIAVYCAALIAMLVASAAYNAARETYRYKEALRRIDHAMIYVKIAGTYTPFVLERLAPPIGLIVFCAVWIMAALGVATKLIFPERNERLSVILYIAMGWTAILVVMPLFSALHHEVFWLLVTGGIVYSAGAPFHLLQSMSFNKVIWHAFVLVATIIQFIAIAIEVA